jgi:superfamily II DNA or RNA helicase
MNRRFIFKNKQGFANKSTTTTTSSSSTINQPPPFQLTSEYKENVLENAYLGKKGYTIPKSALLEEDIAILKKELTMVPDLGFAAGAAAVSSFPVYRENTNKIYLPRFYGIKRYGQPGRSELPSGDDIDISFTKELRDYQNNIVGVYMDYVQEKPSGAILEVPCGRGKCLGKDTPVLMYDGSIMAVQDIVVGDVLMGDDLGKRNVLTLARGRESMYKIKDIVTNNYYIVNESHILSLKNLITNEIIDIELREYLKLGFLKRGELYGYRIPNNKYSTIYDIQIEYVGIDDYYGFEIDGNRRFVLGDYTVTHNTVMALKILAELKKKTLILVHKEFLMNQWVSRIGEFLPSARVGKIQANTFDVEGKDIVIGMIQTMFSRDFDPTVFDCFGLTIIDEVHRIGSEEFSKTLLKVVTPYMLGISATVDRKDGLTKLLYMFIGEKIYTEERKDEDPVVVRGIEYISYDDEFNETEVDWKGMPKVSTMISKICDFGPRSDFIIRVLKDLILENEDSQIMVLAHNRSLLKYLYEAIEYQGFATRGYYIGGMKEAALRETEDQHIVLATYAMAAEALDIKTLSILVMVTPKVDIEQSVGRILRERHSNPIVVDIIDRHDTFQNQWRKRKTFYRKCNYRIIKTTSSKYKGFTSEALADWKTEFEPRTEDKSNRECFENTNDNKKVKEDEIKCVLKKPVGF